MIRRVPTAVFFVFFAIGSPTVEAQLVEDGLISHWTFDENDVDDETVRDVWGENDGTILGFPQLTEGRVGDALEFNGIDDVIDVGSPDDGSLDFGAETDFTIMLWIKVAELPGGQITLVSKGDGGSNPRILFKINATQIFTTIKDGSGGVNVTSDTSVVDDEWHHIAWVADRDEWTRLYVDGILDAEGDPSSANVDSVAPFYIGASVRDDLSTRRFFQGLMDDVSVYERALMEDEIVQNMTGGLCVARRTLGEPRYRPGGSVRVTVEAENVSGSATLVETVPTGWSVTDAGGGTVNGSTISFTLSADGERTYEVTAPADGCDPVTFDGVISGEGGCDTDVVGDDRLTCIPVPAGATVFDFDATGPTADGDLEGFFDFVGVDTSVGPAGWRIEPNAQNAADGSNALHTTGDDNQLENFFSRVALVEPSVFEAQDLFFSADLTFDGLSGDANDNAGIYFRLRGISDDPFENNYYFLRINAGGNSSNIHLHRVKDGFAEQLVSVPNNLPFLVQEGDTVTLSVEAVEETITVLLNGEAIPGLDPYIDEFDPLIECGLVGVGHRSNPTYFDNLTFASLDDSPCPCSATRSLSSDRYRPGDEVTVTLKAVNLPGAGTITDAFPAGWSVTDAGGGTVNGNDIRFDLAADGTVSYRLTIPRDFCEQVEFDGIITGAGDCEGEVFGKSEMICIFGCSDLRASGAPRDMLIIGPIDAGGNTGDDTCDDNGQLEFTDYLANGDTNETDLAVKLGDELTPDFGGDAGGVGVADSPNLDINPDRLGGVLTVWSADTDRDGRINFSDADNVGSPLDDYIIYSLIYLDNTTGDAVDVNLEVGSDDAVKVLVNGEMVHLNAICRGVPGPGSGDIVAATLQPGRNSVLVAVVQRGGGTDVRLCVLDDLFVPLTDGSVVACLAPEDIEPAGASLKPGDVNGDSSFNISDPVLHLSFLFGGAALPECFIVPDAQPVQLTTAGVAILDFTGDGNSDISDAVGALNRLFAAGSPHALGEDCAPVEGSCVSSCQ